MKIQEQMKKLTDARALVKEVQDVLDVNSNVCDKCGLTSYENYGQWQAFDVLAAVLNRLDKTLERMNREPEVFEKVPE